MRSSEAAFALLAVLAAWTGPAEAQQPAQGFALDRLYLSAPGGGWFVMDTLDMRGGLGGVMSLTTDYARDPLRVRTSEGSQRATVVSDEALADFGFAATYGRFRAYLNFGVPLTVAGPGGIVGGYQYAPPSSGQAFTPPGVNLGTAPDALADTRVGFDVRLLGSAWSAFRLGVGAQLLVPSPNTPQSSYLTDGTFRAMGRVLVAGDVGRFTYAGQVGVHVRPLDDSPTPGGPQGNELLFGVAGGARLPVPGHARTLIVGPEVYGASALRSLFGSTGTELEGLLTARIEGTADDGPQVRVKLGAGGGITSQVGAPDWRLVFAIELFDHSGDRDKDGITDTKDACPDVKGVRTKDPKTNGCPIDADADGIPYGEDACPDAAGLMTADPKTNGCPQRPDFPRRPEP
jgi:hypothetical protein